MSYLLGQGRGHVSHVDVERFVAAVTKVKEIHEAFEKADISHLGPDMYEAFEKGYQAGLAKQKPKWIDVLEQCPEHEVDVLVKTDHGEILVAGIFNDRWQGAESEDDLRRPVVTWMPLP